MGREHHRLLAANVGNHRLQCQINVILNLRICRRKLFYLRIVFGLLDELLDFAHVLLVFFGEFLLLFFVFGQAGRQRRYRHVQAVFVDHEHLRHRPPVEMNHGALAGDALAGGLRQSGGDARSPGNVYVLTVRMDRAGGAQMGGKRRDVAGIARHP